MDSDLGFELDRPHISVLDSTQLASIFDYSRKDTTDEFDHAGFVKVISRQLDLGIRYPTKDARFPQITPKDIAVPVNVTCDASDPMSFAVFLREGKKRKRDRKDSMIMSIRVIQFQDPRKELEVLDELQRPSKRNRMVDHWVSAEWPMLSLWVQEANDDHYIINGKIEYGLWYRLGAMPPVFMQEVPGIRKLMEYLVPPETKQRASTQLLYQTMTKNKGVDDFSGEDDKLAVSGLECNLLRYQRKTVRWLLKKEGKRLKKNDVLIDWDEDTLPEWVSWRDDYLCNPYSGCIADLKKIKAAKGGAQLLLAEEMGLGKTVEALAVMLMNTRPPTSSTVYDPELGRDLIPAKCTLIISPASIAKQWKEEIELHAPSLNVIIFHGRGKERGDTVARKLAEYDVVIATYRVISQEVHYAFYNPSARVRSHVQQKRDVEAIQSPLVQMQFWRIILDEVQMVSSGVSDAAKVARVLPRVHAWGVTGTPVNRSMNDLRGILNFLRYEPYASSNHAWDRFIHSPGDFERLFCEIGIRHTTAMVQDDIAIPPQSRVLVPLSFNQIESNNYHHLYERFLEECDLDSYGNVKGSYKPDASAVASWLVRLRQACCHARIGVNKRQLGGRAMNTMGEVLEAMVEQSKSALLANQRKLFVSQIERGQIRENEKNPSASLSVWNDAMREITKIVEQLKLDVAKSDDTQDADEDGDLEKESTVQSLRLRSWYELLHRCYFFIATAHFQLHKRPDNGEDGNVKDSEQLEDAPNGEQLEGASNDEQLEGASNGEQPKDAPNGEQRNDAPDTKTKEEEERPLTEEELEHQRREQEFYEKAELLRREILQEPMKRVHKATEKLRIAAEKQDFVMLKDVMVDDDLGGGIETHGLVEKFNMIGESLNQQAELIDEWREKLIKFLTTKLVDQNADPDGEEYNESLDAQEYAFVYLEVLRQVLSDRNEAVTGVGDPLAKSNVAQDDKTDLQVDLEKLRKETRPINDRSMSLVSLLGDARAVGSEGGSARSGIERELANKVSPILHKTISRSKEELKKLSKEVTMFSDLYNLRVEYYRQLQEISDNVAALEEYDKEQGFENRLNNEMALQKEINQQLGRQRYLANLNADPERERYCVICQSTYALGSWTVCGHEFCRDCINEWWKLRHSCPICKRKIESDEVYNFRVHQNDQKDTEMETSRAHEHASQGNHENGGIYTDMSSAKIQEISDIPIESKFRYGTKIDFMVRHLNWLRESDPTAQVVVFSQWKEMLELIELALEDNKIQFATVGDRVSKFKHDPAVACFLLHAKSQSAGLTLVNATHVYLVEPLVNTALELQAISRIHRIGQTKPTTVWCFVISNSVEEAVVRLSSAKRRATFEAEHPLDQHQLDKNKEQEFTKSIGAMVDKRAVGGEVVAEHDLWTVLFNKPT